MYKLASFFIAFFIVFSLISCYKDEGLTSNVSASWIAGKKWKIDYYKVFNDNVPTEYSVYKEYTLKFESNFDVNADTQIEIRNGRWIVYSGVSSNILQITYPQYLKDVWQLSGNWVIVDQQMNTLLLRQSNIEMHLTVIE